jgi:hypothetical protein
MKTAFLILPLLALLGVALCWAIYAWNSIERPWLHSHDPRHLFLARNWLPSYGADVLQQPPWLRRHRPT